MSNEEEPNFKLKRSMQKEYNKSRNETAKILELTENQINLINELQKQELSVHFDFMQYYLYEKCDKFLETRFCHKFKSCQNYHMDWQRRRPPFYQQEGKYRILYRDIICPNIAAKVKCNLGDICGFSHNFEEVSYHPCRLKSIICNRKDCRGEWVCAYAHKKDKTKYNYNDLRNYLSDKYKDILIKESKRAERTDPRYSPIRDRMVVQVNVPSFFKEEYEREKKERERKVREGVYENYEEFTMGMRNTDYKSDDHYESSDDLMFEKNNLDITDKYSRNNHNHHHNNNNQGYGNVPDFNYQDDTFRLSEYAQPKQPSQQEQEGVNHNLNNNTNSNTMSNMNNFQNQDYFPESIHYGVPDLEQSKYPSRYTANMNIISLDHHLRLNPMIQDQKFNMIYTYDIFTPSTFKTRKCEYNIMHDTNKCIYYHDNSERRRKLLVTSEEYNKHKYNYTSDMCFSMNNNENCNYGENCNYCHTYNELMYHPDNFKKFYCQHYPDVKECDYGSYCADAHTDSELVGTILHTIIRDDRFFRFLFKTIMCPFKHQHEMHQCVYAHSITEFRRNPAIFKYSPYKCDRIDFGKQVSVYRDYGCPDDAFCMYSHSTNEMNFHPDTYKRRECSRTDCDGTFCYHYHKDEQQKENKDYNTKMNTFEMNLGKIENSMRENMGGFNLKQNNYTGENESNFRNDFNYKESEEIEEDEEEDGAPRRRKTSKDIVDSNWDYYGDLREVQESNLDGWEHEDEIAHIISNNIDFHKSVRGQQGLLRYSLYDSTDGFEELLAKYNILHLKETVYELYGSEFLITKLPIDLTQLDKVKDDIQPDEITILKTVLKEFNESLMVEKLTHNN